MNEVKNGDGGKVLDNQWGGEIYLIISIIFILFCILFGYLACTIIDKLSTLIELLKLILGKL